MDKKKLVLLLGALIIAIGTAMAARSMFAGASAPDASASAQEPKGPKVLVSQRALPVGTIITADSISFQMWPKEMVQDAYFIDGEADMTKLLGTVVRFPVTAFVCAFGTGGESPPPAGLTVTTVPPAQGVSCIASRPFTSGHL